MSTPFHFFKLLTSKIDQTGRQSVTAFNSKSVCMRKLNFSLLLSKTGWLRAEIIGQNNFKAIPLEVVLLNLINSWNWFLEWKKKKKMSRNVWQGETGLISTCPANWKQDQFPKVGNIFRAADFYFHCSNGRAYCWLTGIDLACNMFQIAFRSSVERRKQLNGNNRWQFFP